MLLGEHLIGCDGLYLSILLACHVVLVTPMTGFSVRISHPRPLNSSLLFPPLVAPSRLFPEALPP
jgi:hypothetical protein